QGNGDGAGDGEGAPGGAGDELDDPGTQGDGLAVLHFVFAGQGGAGGAGRLRNLKLECFGPHLPFLGGLVASLAAGGVGEGRGVFNHLAIVGFGSGSRRQLDLRAFRQLDFLSAERLDNDVAQAGKGDDDNEEDGGGDDDGGGFAQFGAGDLGERAAAAA